MGDSTRGGPSRCSWPGERIDARGLATLRGRSTAHNASLVQATRKRHLGRRCATLRLDYELLRID